MIDQMHASNHRSFLYCAAMVDFEHAVYSVSEDSGSVDVCAQVNRIRAGSDAINIRLSTEDDTAKGTL